MEKTIMTMMMVMIMVVLLSQVVLGISPAPPTKDYCCPIPGCGECFYTYEELYAHFTAAHPTQPIDIIWE